MDAAIRHDAATLARTIRAFLQEPHRYVSPSEEQWWRRMLGNLEKAQHDNPHVSARYAP